MIMWSRGQTLSETKCAHPIPAIPRYSGDSGDFYGTEGVPTTWQEPLVMNSIG